MNVSLASVLRIGLALAGAASIAAGGFFVANQPSLGLIGVGVGWLLLVGSIYKRT